MNVLIIEETCVDFFFEVTYNLKKISLTEENREKVYLKTLLKS